MVNWKAIESAYASAPYFDYYGDEVKSLIYSETSDLITYNEQIISFIAETLSLSCSIQYTNEYAATYTALRYPAEHLPGATAPV